MAESLSIPTDVSKEQKYKALLPQVEGLLSYEEDLQANQANLFRVLKEAFDFLWVGFYRLENNQLILGPFQGPIACTRIPIGRGVCGVAAEKQETLIVPNVDEFSGHIACSSLAKSEIVVPIFKDNSVVAILDIDSDKLNDFDETDKKYLEQLCAQLSELF